MSSILRRQKILLGRCSLKTYERCFYVDARAEVTDPSKWYQPQLSMVSKLERLIEEGGVLDTVSKGDVVAVKTHFGIDIGTTKTLRSVFIRAVVEKVIEAGGKPFVIETPG